MSQHVQTYAPGTRVRTVPSELAHPDLHAGDVGTVMETSTYGGVWAIWVAWDETNPSGDETPRSGYTFEQLEAVDE